MIDHDRLALFLTNMSKLLMERQHGYIDVMGYMRSDGSGKTIVAVLYRYSVSTPVARFVFFPTGDVEVRDTSHDQFFSTQSSFTTSLLQKDLAVCKMLAAYRRHLAQERRDVIRHLLNPVQRKTA